MTNAELKAIVQREEYDFLRTNKHLGSNILFLTLSGSHAYGTNVEDSDIDMRGVAGSPEILGFNRFEQAIDNQTDTVIYAVNKFVSLLAQGNPNIIELLGNDPELYVNMTPEGQMLLDNRTLFLTRRIAYSYGGFANDQLRRLQMGLLRNGTSPEPLKNRFEKRSLERSIVGWGKDDIFEISISEDTDEEGKHPLLISGSLNKSPPHSRDFSRELGGVFFAIYRDIWYNINGDSYGKRKRFGINIWSRICLQNSISCCLVRQVSQKSYYRRCGAVAQKRAVGNGAKFRSPHFRNGMHARPYPSAVGLLAAALHPYNN